MTRGAIWSAVVVIAGLAACSGGEADDSGVASLDDATTEIAAEDEDSAHGPGTAEPGEVEDAFVEFAGCMREHGIDMPDPTPDDLTIAFPAPEIEAEQPGYEAAYDACIPIVEAVTGPFDTDMSPEDTAEMQDHLLAVARCMRELGYDYPDPQFGDDGMVVAGEEQGVLDEPIEQYEHDLQDCSDEASSTAGEG